MRYKVSIQKTEEESLENICFQFAPRLITGHHEPAKIQSVEACQDWHI